MDTSILDVFDDRHGPDPPFRGDSIDLNFLGIFEELGDHNRLLRRNVGCFVQKKLAFLGIGRLP